MCSDGGDTNKQRIRSRSAQLTFRRLQRALAGFAAPASALGNNIARQILRSVPQLSDCQPEMHSANSGTLAD